MSRRNFIRYSGFALGTLALPSWIYSARIGEFTSSTVDNDSLADIALAEAKKAGATYADIRINTYRIESVGTREKQVQFVSKGENSGFGIRVLIDGTWGFAASPDVSEAEVKRVAGDAAAIAKANSVFNKNKIELVPAEKAVGEWKTEFRIDPFEVSIDEKIEFLLNMNEAALSVKGVSFVNSSMAWVNEQKFTATSDGSRITQYLIRGVPSFSVTAIDRAKGDFQTRNSLAQGSGSGWEYTKDYDWIGEAKQAGEEAVGKLGAKPVEPGKYDLVLHPSHLFLTIHESVGHSTELDRALLWEANYAGTSFLTPDKTNKLQFGSKIVNFVADRTQKGGLATVGWDDEGVPGQEWDIVKDGRFVGWQTTRDLAPFIGEKTSRGCLYGDSWNSVPFPRMPNLSLSPSPKDTKTEELIADVEKGIMIHGRGSYSIDQQRYNFQFGGQTFWEIEKGKVKGMLRDVAYQSRTTDFWNACDGLGGKSTYELPGTFNDGKGEPGQSNAVSHGCPTARFRDIDVLNTAS
ncbi:MAG: TldD/PmbA family protein [Acidobacteria bacterium]|nr:MAG: TldD/PmbA family protein [Acidobacteriota bacterium]REK03119.1 MAG: TldD/PmbA family protein [Acidobacteriota bacterium]REK15466.1 MAG: TldD/PmbA family protein [Acidobacteriota bacterium]REK45817.1 MAG: TldD/PmbA family protein [Acidobacteriota bacterium]